MIVLDPHQQQCVEAWQQFNGRGFLVIVPTGGGKSYIASKITDIESARGHVFIFAHRDVLCEQLSMSLCDFGIEHDFITSNAVRTNITNHQMLVYGRSYWSRTSNVIVVSVDTFKARLRKGELPPCIQQANVCLFDEGHHVLQTNKWGECFDAFPKSTRICKFTASPIRTDGKLIGSAADGYVDDYIEPVTMRQLIEYGRLSDYRLMVPPDAEEINIRVRKLRKDSKGEFNKKESEALVDTLEINGDIAATIKKHCPNEQGIVFAVTVEHSKHIAEAIRKVGIRAEAINGDTPTHIRNRLVQEFREGKLQVLVNVGLFDEGFDVPNVRFVSMARPTMSWQKYIQMFGRAVRAIKGKLYGWVFDHVGNSILHGLPDNGRDFVLNKDKNKRRKSYNTDSEEQMRICTNPECCSAYRIPATHCPYCGHVPVVDERRPYKTKSGELIELTPELMAELYVERRRVDMSSEAIYNAHKRSGKADFVARKIANEHEKRQQAQRELRETILQWHLKYFGGINDKNLKVSQQQFAQIFKIDVFKAQTLSTNEAIQLTERIQNHGR